MIPKLNIDQLLNKLLNKLINPFQLYSKHFSLLYKINVFNKYFDRIILFDMVIKVMGMP